MSSNDEDWMTSHDVGAFLSGRRNNDVRVEVGGQKVPIHDVRYDRTADMMVIELDTESDAYQTAFAHDPIPPRGRPPEPPNIGPWR